MATTYTLLGNQFNAGEHCLKWRVNSDGGGGGTQVIANADIVNNLRGNSPLRAKFSQTFGSASDARDALINTDQVSLRGFLQSGASVWTLDVGIDGSGKPTVVATLSAVNTQLMVELRFHNSYVQ